MTARKCILKTLLRRGFASRRKAADIGTSPEDFNSFVQRLESISGEEIKKFFTVKSVKIRAVRDNRIISELSPQESIKVVIPAFILDGIFGNFRDVVYERGVIYVEGVSTEGKLHNYVCRDSLCTIMYNMITQVVSLHFKVISGLTKEAIPDESVTFQPSPKNAKISRRDTLCPRWAIITDIKSNYSPSGTNGIMTTNMTWLIEEICKSTCIMELDRVLVYAYDSEYSILYDVFDLGSKPKHGNVSSHFSSCMSEKRKLVSIDDSDIAINEVVIDDDIDEDAVELLENENEENELAVEG
jgi:hypothetical protein